PRARSAARRFVVMTERLCSTRRAASPDSNSCVKISAAADDVNAVIAPQAEVTRSTSVSGSAAKPSRSEGLKLFEVLVTNDVTSGAIDAIGGGAEDSRNP